MRCEKKMKLPNPIEVRNDLSKTIESLDFFVEFISTKDLVSFFEFHAQLHTINLELINVWNRIRFLTVTDRKYSKAFEKLRKILTKILIDSSQIESKHVKDRMTSWESTFQEGKLRKDLISHFKRISKQLKKIQKNI